MNAPKLGEDIAGRAPTRRQRCHSLHPREYHPRLGVGAGGAGGNAAAEAQGIPGGARLLKQRRGQREVHTLPTGLGTQA